MSDRIPCPVCKSAQTVEDIYRKAIKIECQAKGLDPTPMSTTHWHLIYTLPEECNGKERLDGMETCTNCGVIYRPGLKLATSQAQAFLAKTQKTYLLDALADAAAEPEDSG